MFLGIFVSLELKYSKHYKALKIIGNHAKNCLLWIFGWNVSLYKVQTNKQTKKLNAQNIERWF